MNITYLMPILICASSVNRGLFSPRKIVFCGLLTISELYPIHISLYLLLQAGLRCLSYIGICRHKEVERFHFIFNCSTYNFDVKDSFKLMRLPGWYCKIDNVFYVILICYHLTIFFGEEKFNRLPFKNELVD